jgi:hypothetical protein
MPTLISETDVRLERSDLLRRIQLPRSVSADGFIVPPPRTPGLHLSGLLKYVAQKSKITSYIDQVSDEDLPIRWMLGVIFEEFAASLMPEMIWQPGEVTDPVIMTCDGAQLDEDGNSVIKEFKFNRAKKYSGADLLKKKWLWMQQGLGYCLGYGPCRVEWNVMSVMEWPDPVWTRYLVEFSDKELGDMRRMIEVNRAGAIAEGYSE